MALFQQSQTSVFVAQVVEYQAEGPGDPGSNPACRSFDLKSASDMSLLRSDQTFQFPVLVTKDIF